MGEGLALRQVRETDRWTLWEWRNSVRIRRVSIHDEEIPRSAHDQWFTEHFPTMRDKTIIVEWDNSAVGWYQIERWDPKAKSGEWGVALGDLDVPIGLGGALPILALSHAFERLNARIMTGRVLELNINMISIMRRLTIPILAVNDDGVPRLDGNTSRTVVYQLRHSEWRGVFDAGQLLVPSSLRSSIVRVISEPILD